MANTRRRKRVPTSDKVKDHAREMLLQYLQPGDKVYTVLRHVTKGGMSRSIATYVAGIDRTSLDPALERLDFYVMLLLDLPFDSKHGGLKVHGCGMDMGFQLVYWLGQALWPSGTPTPHGKRNGKPDSSGGYALKQEWL